MGKWYTKPKKLKIPYYPYFADQSVDNMEHKYIIQTIEEKRIAEYLQITMLEVENLDIIEYYFYLREAFIYNCMQSEDGREYLQNAYRLEETSPDRDNLRKNFKNKLED